MKKLAARILGRPRGWNLARAPAGSSFVLLSRGRTRYRLEGPSEGPLLLLVHGMTYPLEVWNMQVPALVGSAFGSCAMICEAVAFRSSKEEDWI